MKIGKVKKIIKRMLVASLTAGLLVGTFGVSSAAAEKGLCRK